jgi:hypothetical protein
MNFSKTTRRFRSMGPSHGSTFHPSFPKGAKPTKCRGWKQKPSLGRRLLRNIGKRSSRWELMPSWQKTRKSRFGTRLAFTSSPSPGPKKFCKGSHHEKTPPHSHRYLPWLTSAFAQSNAAASSTKPATVETIEADDHGQISTQPSIPAISSGC